MKYALLLTTMIFMHIVDDYYLQGILAKLKQRKWWQDNAPDNFYKSDYIPALIAHAFSWSFMVTLPILLITHWQPHWLIMLLFAINIVIHSIVDDLKANKKKINLIIDQTIHIIQIIVVWAVYVLISIAY